jgi:putative transposase
MIDPNLLDVPISEQCNDLGIARSSYYYRSAGESELNLELMDLIDRLHMDFPAWGSRKIRDRLRLDGYKVNRKRIRRLMTLMGITAIYQAPNLSKPNKEHKVYPYLLRRIKIDRPDLVWCTDITYIRLHRGFVYLVAIMDWYSKAILSWELSNTQDSHFCVSALNTAFDRYGKPEIFNTDQGAQFTSNKFIEELEERNIKISMNGKGRALDNVAIERFWRTLKYEEVYLKDYMSMKEARENIGRFIQLYNSYRPHDSLKGLPPMGVYSKNPLDRAA